MRSGGGALLTLSLLAVAAVAIAASSLSSSPSGDHRIVVPILETTADSPGLSATPQPQLHSIKERAAVLLPVAEDESRGETGTEEDEDGAKVIGQRADDVGEEEMRPQGDIGGECLRRMGTRRNSLDNNFMRFGRSDGKVANQKDPSFARNGRDRNFIRLGRSGGGNNFIRLGRGSSEDEEGQRYSRGSSNNFMRFGRRRQEDNEDDNDNMERYSRTTLDRNFMRFGRSSGDLVRSGRTQQQSANLDRNFMRLGRSDSSDGTMDRVYRGSLDRNFMRFGRGSEDRNFIRFGRGSGNNFMRFGRDVEDEEKEGTGNSQRSKRSAGEYYDGGEPIIREDGETSGSAWWGYPRYYQDLFLLPSYMEREGERIRRGRENFIRFG